MNREIYQALEDAKKKKIKYWQIADAVGIADTTLSRWLRHEIPIDKRATILAAIKKLERSAAI